MELGNLVFGNSRGEYPVPRDAGWEDEVRRLFLACAGSDDVRYGVDYENETFWVARYYWGDCTCGWDDWDEGHEELEALEHWPACYQTDWRRINRGRTAINEPERRRLIEVAYQKRGWDTNRPDWWHGCAVRCDCDYGARRTRVLHKYAEGFGCLGHEPSCLLVRDNFRYKPTGFGIQWYKYPLRDAYANQAISLPEFRAMIDACIASVKERKTMRVFFDTEFTGLFQAATLVSIALVAEDGRIFYAEATDYDPAQCSDWVSENLEYTGHPTNERGEVLVGATTVVVGPTETIAARLREWLEGLDAVIEMWGDVLAYDWVLFCELFGGAFGIPTNVKYIPLDISTLLAVHGEDPDVDREEFAGLSSLKLNKHNALTDARVARAVFHVLMGE